MKKDIKKLMKEMRDATISLLVLNLLKEMQLRQKGSLTAQEISDIAMNLKDQP